MTGLDEVPARPGSGASSTRAAPGMDLAPPVTPNLASARPVPGASRVGRNIVETLVFRGLSTPIALLLVVVQSRLLEPAGRGTFVLLVLSVTIASRLLGQLGVAVTNRVREAPEEIGSLVRRALTLAVTLGLAGGVPIVAWTVLADDIRLDVAVLAALGLVPNVLWQTVSGVLLGVSRIRVWNLVQLLSPVLTLLGTLVLVLGLDGGVRAAVLAWTLAHVLTAAFALAATRDLWLPLRLPHALDRHGRTLLRLALALGAVQVLNLVSYRIELFVLGGFEGVAAVGVYSIAMQAAESMWLAGAAVATAVTAPVVHESEERAASLVAHAVGRSLLLTAPIAVVLGAAAPFVIPLALGEGFADAALPLALLLPGAVAYAPVSVLVVYLSIRRGRPQLSLAVSFVSLAVTLAASLVLIPRYGVEGAGVASSVGYGGGGLLAWLLFVRLARLRPDGRARRPLPAGG